MADLTLHRKDSSTNPSFSFPSIYLTKRRTFLNEHVILEEARIEMERFDYNKNKIIDLGGKKQEI